MSAEELKELIAHIYNEAKENFIPTLPEAKLYEEPLVGIGSATDSLFNEYKKPGIIGPWYMTPEEWLPGSKSVISLFFPASREVKESNRKMKDGTGEYWLYARVEGQTFIQNLMMRLKSILEDEYGMKTCVPQYDNRFQVVVAGKGITGYPEINEKTFGSNWSERHAGFICGLGTFGLSKGLITEKGMAGRMGSIIIDKELTPTKRKYTDLYEYCNRCGACVKRCFRNAITLEEGKNHNICEEWLGQAKKLYAPRYGCGLCQTGTPCESGIPGKKEGII
ncbi:MAG: epoxyqueuosine reductase [Lachnospiraceae bacterium]|nr:epoxyqueuosine reductase [Lachnospiraceae bacterium]